MDTDAKLLMPKILKTPDSSENHFSISAGEPTEGEVIITCRGLGGNRPMEYANNLALWSSSLPNIASADEPLKVLPMPNNNQPNSVLFPYPFQPTDYCLTYQVGSTVSTMCALTNLSLFPKAMSAAPRSVLLDILEVTTESVLVRYITLPGYQPGKYGNWIGIWGGYAVPYGSPPPLGRSSITSFQSEDVVTIDKLTLHNSMTYTLIYFMQDAEQDPNRFAAGAILYFSCGAFTNQLKPKGVCT